MIMELGGYKASYEWIPYMGQFVAELEDVPMVVCFCASSKHELEQLMLESIAQLKLFVQDY